MREMVMEKMRKCDQGGVRKCDKGDDEGGSEDV